MRIFLLTYQNIKLNIWYVNTVTATPYHTINLNTPTGMFVKKHKFFFETEEQKKKSPLYYISCLNGWDQANLSSKHTLSLKINGFAGPGLKHLVIIIHRSFVTKQRIFIYANWDSKRSVFVKISTMLHAQNQGFQLFADAQLTRKILVVAYHLIFLWFCIALWPIYYSIMAQH